MSFIGTCVTGIFVCFLGAGAANLGWKTFDPMATSLTGAHHADDQAQAKLPQEAYNQIIARDSAASIKAMLDEQVFQLDNYYAHQRARVQSANADELLKDAISQQNESLFAQDAREQAGEKLTKIQHGLQLLPEQETRDQ